MPKNSLAGEHLNDKKDIIRAGLYTPDQFYLGDTKANIQKMAEPGQNVNYYGNEVSRKTSNILNGGEKSYCISDCNSLPKYSTGYADCTGVTVVGVEKNTGEQISILTHEDPKFFLEGEIGPVQFKKDLVKRVTELKKKSLKGTIDTVIYGGYFRYDNYEYNYKKYIYSLRLLNEILKDVLGFDPVVINGPNLHLHNGATDVYLDTANRRLHLIRPTQYRNETNHPFLLKDISKFDYYMGDKNLENMTDHC